jgi:glutathione S-transferase
MKIHMMPVSQSALGPVLLGMHLGIGEGVLCDLMSGQHKKPEYLAIHPYGTIPGLEDGSFTLGESNAILRYLAMSQNSPLYPLTDPEKCGKIDFALDAFSNVYQAHVFVVYKVLGFGGENDNQTKANEDYTNAISKWFEIHVDSDPQKKFVAGDQLTIADFKIAPFMYSAIQPVMEKKTGFKPPERAVKYCKDFKDAVEASKFMEEGADSLFNFCQSKENVN